MKLEEELNAAEETISFQIDPAAVVIQHLDRAIAQITHDILGKCVVVLLAPP
jgi:flagellar biosynthesis component FlhA